MSLDIGSSHYLKEDFMKFKIKEETTKDEMKVIGTYVTSEVYFQLKTEAEENFMSLSSLIKKIIFRYLKENNTKNKLN